MYTKEIISLFCEMIAGNRSAYKMLMDNGYQELIMVNEALGGKKEGFQWLMENKKYIPAAFVNAIMDENKKSVAFLMKMKAPQLAAVANAIIGDPNALDWLKKNGLEHYVKLVDAIEKKFENDEGHGLSFLFKGPFS